MTERSEGAALLVGPLLRYVDDHRATIWVETDRPCTVDVLGHRQATWSVHGHHYALVRIDDLAPRTSTPYTVELDGEHVWPEPGSGFPPSAIRTADPASPFRLAFGSCRRSAPFDADNLAALGADALVALAGRMVAEGPERWPHELLLLGDQVYADDPSDAIAQRLRDAHHHSDPEIAGEIQDFEEYTWLYHESWTVPALRWLFSTVPLCMMLDDHDLRDDWNTSITWRREVTARPWWRDRVVGAYASYWVYQHLGNLSPEQLDENEEYAQVCAIDDDDERTRYLDDMAWRTDEDASATRFSFYRDLGGDGRGVRLLVIDSRCARHLDPHDRRMVDAAEWEWVRRHVLDVDHSLDHLVLASTLPFLLVPGIHHLEGWDEAIAEGAWGRVGKAVGERVRQALDLEHWAAFRESLNDVVTLLEDVVTAEPSPASVVMLSGDIHCSYTARAHLRAAPQASTDIHQLVMSPFRNDIQRIAKVANRVLARRRPAGTVRRLARLAKVRDVDLDWRVENGPWFDNGVMVLEFNGREVQVAVDHAAVVGAQQVLNRTMTVDLGRTDEPRRQRA